MSQKTGHRWSMAVAVKFCQVPQAVAQPDWLISAEAIWLLTRCHVVGTAGFEPTTPCSPPLRAYRAREPQTLIRRTSL